MNKRSIAYMQSHDIDWFFKANGNYYHSASNGGLIPMACRNIVTLNRVSKAVSTLPEIFDIDEISINDAYIKSVVNQQHELWRGALESNEDSNAVINDDMIRDDMIRDFLLSSFIFMALRGFISIDRIMDDNVNVAINNKEYHEDYVIIARPKELPDSIPLIFDRPYNTDFIDLSTKLVRINDDRVRIYVN